MTDDKERVRLLDRIRTEQIRRGERSPFEIRDVDNNPDYADYYTLRGFGAQAVRGYDEIIEREAATHGVDADLVRSIMFAENSQGGLYGYLADAIGVSSSVLPMNIQKRWFEVLGMPVESIHDPESNIRAGVKVLKEIQDRVEDPTPEKIATLWHSLGSTETSDFGERVDEIMRNQEWVTGVDVPDFEAQKREEIMRSSASTNTNNIVAGEFSGMTRAQRIALEPIKDFDTLINTTAADFGRMIFRQGGGRGGNIFNPINTDAFASQVGNILGRNLAGFAAGSAGELLSNALGGGTKTRVTECESARSQEAEENFRESRGQVQKRLARELVRGRRYS
jgi:hypothetical protein